MITHFMSIIELRLFRAICLFRQFPLLLPDPVGEPDKGAVSIHQARKSPARRDCGRIRARLRNTVQHLARAPRPPGRPPWSIDATQLAPENAALLFDPLAPVRVASESRWQGSGNLFNLPGHLEHPDMLCVLHRNAAGWGWHSSGTYVGGHDL